MWAPEYEVVIYGADDEDIVAIAQALAAAGIIGDDRDEIGKYLRDGKPRSIFIGPTDLTEAIETINELGFSTDEDTYPTPDSD